MQSTLLVERVRHLVRKTFSQLGSDTADDPVESLLIRDGHFCGRSFETETMWAVWFIEENEVKFYDGHGVILKAMTPDPGHDLPTRKAA